MALEMIILSEASQTEKDKYQRCHLHGGSKKNDTNELIHKAETDSQTLKTSVWLPKGELGVAG